MPRCPIVALLVLAAAAAPPAAPLAAQGAPAASAPAARDAARPPARDTARDTARPPARIFDAIEPIAVTLTANLAQLRDDDEDGAPWRRATLSYVDSAGATVALPVRVRTRGIWRLKNCAFPPLRLDFPRREASATLFAGLDEPKLVTHCRDDDRSEQYLLQEMQLYRIYQLLTPASHRARLLRVAYVDSASGRAADTRHAILLEETKALARRLGGVEVEERGASGDYLDPDGAALMAVFQYFIGNADWSVPALHNVELVIRGDGAVVPIAYDFDFAGAVDAHYAAPPPQLGMRDVRERRFRGYCLPPESYERAFAAFDAGRRTAIAGLYEDAVGRLLDRRTAGRALAYFDEFYRTIDNPRARRRVVEACLGGR